MMTEIDLGNGLHLERIIGTEALKHIPSVAALHVEVFRDFPYLYDRSPQYEERLLGIYFANCADPLFLLVRDGDRLVGASTARSLCNRMLVSDGVEALFRKQGLKPERVFYLADSVLQPEYRGRGIGVKFFELRETHARDAGYELASFCSVQRPPDHPLRPTESQPLNNFWRHRGYRPVQGLCIEFTWKDVGRDRPSSKIMQYWLKDLRVRE